MITMSKTTKYLSFALFIFIVITVAICFFPTLSSSLSSMLYLNNEELNTLLMAIDIILSSSISICSNIEQNRIYKSHQYSFSIEEDNLSFDEYSRTEADIKNSYYYEYKREKTNIKNPFYEVDFPFVEGSTCCVGIPICVNIRTKMIGENLTFSNFRLFCYKKHKLKHKHVNKWKFLEINNPIIDDDKFLIRIQLLCTPKLEKELLDSYIYISFKLSFTDDMGQRHKKYILQKIQSTNKKFTLLSTIIKHSWISFLFQHIKLRYKLYKHN